MLIFRGVNPDRLGTYHAKKLTLTTPPPLNPTKTPPDQAMEKYVNLTGDTDGIVQSTGSDGKAGVFFKQTVSNLWTLGMSWWWQLKHFLFSSHTWGNDPILTHIFSNGF